MTLVATATAASVYRPVPLEAAVLKGGERFTGPGTAPVTPAVTDRLVFFKEDEAKLIGEIFDCLIPEDALSPAATDMGCVTFIDNQLAGKYGSAWWRYKKGPYVEGTKEQGPQIELTPAELYRKALAAISADVTKTYGKSFGDLTEEQKVAYLEELEAGKRNLDGVSGASVFQQFLTNAREGLLADPIYGGNKDMQAWKMVGFPGARYDYRLQITKRNQDLGLKPVSLSDLG